MKLKNACALGKINKKILFFVDLNKLNKLAL